MKGVLFLLAAGLGLSAADARPLSLLVRDLRTVKDGRCVVFNIGTAAHAPSSVAQVLKAWPDADVTLWADAPLEDSYVAMIRRRFPNVGIVWGDLENPAQTNAALEAAVSRADALVIGSSSGVFGRVGASARQFRARTGKPVGALSMGTPHADMKDYAFAFFRDELAIANGRKKGWVSPVAGYAPDSVFDFDCRDEAGADAFLRAHGLESGKFVCAIPGNRRTPRWTFWGTEPDARTIAENAAHVEADHAPLRAAIVEAVRKYGQKVLICAEQRTELDLIRPYVYDRLPEDVRKGCVVQESFWMPDLALSVYLRSRLVFGIEMHSQVMALGSGVPAVLFHHPGFGTKADMWRTIGCGDWRVDLTAEDALEKAVDVVGGILADLAAAEARCRAVRAFLDRSEREMFDKIAACLWTTVPKAWKSPARQRLPKVLGRDFWHMARSWRYTNPLEPLDRPFDDPGLAKDPMFADLGLTWLSTKPLYPDKMKEYCYPRIVDEFWNETAQCWKNLEKNPKPDRPLVLSLISKRGLYPPVGPIHPDADDFRAWKGRHPNFLYCWTAAEWDNDMIHNRLRMKGHPDKALVRAMEETWGSYAFSNRSDRLAYAEKFFARQKALFYGDGDTCSVRASLALDHMAAAWGAKYLTIETSNTSDSLCEYRWDVSSMFTRGAARQFGRPWGWFVATFVNGPKKGGGWMNDSGPSMACPGCGISKSLERRAWHYAYLNGAWSVESESGWTTSFYTTNTPSGKIAFSDRGLNYRRFWEFTKAHPGRGSTYAPVAVLVPFDQGYPAIGGRAWGFGGVPYRDGDRLVDGVFFTIAPGWDRPTLIKRGYTERCLHNSEIPMMFDVLAPDSPQPDAEFLSVLADYPAAILTGDYKDRPELLKKLLKWVEAGGELVVPAALAESLAFRPGERRKVGKGMVVVSSSPWMLPAQKADAQEAMREVFTGKTKFPEVRTELMRLRDRYFPVSVSGGEVQYGLNRTPTGWWLWAFNNAGIRKFADASEETDPSAATVTFDFTRLGAVPSRELLSGMSLAVPDMRVTWTLPPGEIAVFEIANR